MLPTAQNQPPGPANRQEIHVRLLLGWVTDSTKLQQIKKMKQYASILIAALAGCTSGPSPVTEPIPEARILTSAGVMATDPYFTSDQYGNPVLSWPEQLPGSEDYLLKYAVFDQIGSDTYRERK